MDEFRRAEPRLFDAIQAGICSENLVFITSTMHYFRRFTKGTEAPLKGLFSIMKFEEARKILIVPGETIVPETTLEVWDVRTILKEIKRKTSRLAEPQSQ